jgi:hypothetical protein
MKKTIIILLLTLAGALAPVAGKAQSVADLLEQLALDYQKLASMKNTLSQMYKGYEVLTRGYNSVKDVSQGNFTLHRIYLDGLLTASPAVRKYPRVNDIMNDQAALVSEYRSAWNSFSHDPNFKPEELSYMRKLYENLLTAGQKDLDDLSVILSDNQLRMNDAERLAAIDRICIDSHSQLNYLRKYNDQAYKTTLQRSDENNDRQSMKTLNGIN